MAAVRVFCPHGSASLSMPSQAGTPPMCCPRCGGVLPNSSSPPDSRPATDPPGSTATFARPAAPDAGLPEAFGRYRILSKLGQGGMGAVYLATDTTLALQVALKVPYFQAGGSRTLVERFLREARAAAKIDHPNLCPVHDVGQVDGVYYLTMPYIKGRTLAEVLAARKPTPPHQIAAVVRKLALVLDVAHRAGIVHRDLKPSNIMLSRNRELVVMDFGLARLDDPAEASLTGSGAVMGTPLYMSPEQVAGEAYAVGPASETDAWERSSSRCSPGARRSSGRPRR